MKTQSVVESFTTAPKTIRPHKTTRTSARPRPPARKRNSDGQIIYVPVRVGVLRMPGASSDLTMEEIGKLNLRQHNQLIRKILLNLVLPENSNGRAFWSYAAPPLWWSKDITFIITPKISDDQNLPPPK